MAQIPNSHLFVNGNDVTVFVDSRNIYIHLTIHLSLELGSRTQRIACFAFLQ